jgi:serine protease Do
MKFKFLSSLAAVALAIPVFAADPAPKEQTAPKKMPALITDDSPVAQGASSGLVTSYADVIEPVQKAVVSIYSTRTVHQQINPFYRQLFGDQVPPDRDAKEKGLGSGVIISADGYILTNNHVVEGADELSVLLTDDRDLKARVIGADPKTDIAVIKIDAENLPVMVLADSDKLRVGDVVFAIGNPLEVGQTVTMGIVSAKNRRSVHILDNNGYEDFIQTDAAINMGNSGGALIDAKGRLVGINSAILSPSNGNIGIGFSVPINLAASIMRSLIETGTVSRGYLGVGVDAVTSDLADALGLSKGTKGVILNSVNPDSPAAKAGLKQEDVIVAIDGKNITSSEELRLYVSQKVPDTVVTVKYLRDGKDNTTSVKLGLLPDDSLGQSEILPGISVSRLTDEVRRTLNINDERISDGLVVTDVDASSPYADQLQPKMVILQINRVDISDVASAKAAIRSGFRNLFFVYSRGRRTFIPIDVK